MAESKSFSPPWLDRLLGFQELKTVSISFTDYFHKLNQALKPPQLRNLFQGNFRAWMLIPVLGLAIAPSLKLLQPPRPDVQSGDVPILPVAPPPTQLPTPQAQAQPQSAPAPKVTPKAAKPVPKPQPPQQQAQGPAVPTSVPSPGILKIGTDAITLRVAIVQGSKTLLLGTSTPAQLLDAQGQVIKKISPGEGILAQLEKGQLRLNAEAVPAVVWIQPGKDGAVYVGNRWYRGAVQVSQENKTLLAVNYVDLEDYLYSVVSSEVSPSWPLEAQKAQAIAARSFALVHYFRPAHARYDLGSTQRWQVYGGLSHEWNTSQQVVESTRGLVLSYRGGVVESQYAASEAIVKGVHGGRGMSQQGAYKLAMQGYRFEQILGFFYPGARLAWLKV